MADYRGVIPHGGEGAGQGARGRGGRNERGERGEVENKKRPTNWPVFFCVVSLGLLSDGEGKAVDFVPLAAGEVGHHDRHGAVVDGDFGKLYE